MKNHSGQVRVWDLGVRAFHWTLVAAFAVAWLSGDEAEFLHVNAGYLVGALLVFRVIWGFVGGRHARFADFVRRPSEVRRYIEDAVRSRAPRHLGHNPAGGAMAIALLVSLVLTVASGLALYGATDFAGPLAGLFRGDFAADVLKDIHELGANLTLGLVLLHLAGVVFTSLETRENLIRSMITGRKKEIPS